MARFWMSRKQPIYIVPTVYGLVWLGVIVVMLLAGSSSGNNLVFLTSFLLLAVFLVGMLATHRNLNSIEIVHTVIEDTFSDEPGRVRVLIRNLSREDKRRLSLVARKKKFRIEDARSFDILPSSEREFSALYRASGRGRAPVVTFRLGSSFPLGLFYSWRMFSSEGEAYIFPRRRGELALPLQSRSRETSTEIQMSLGGGGPEDFSEHRRHQLGESLARVDWKAFARRRDLLVKNFSEASQGQVSVRWLSQFDQNPEAGLEQMAEWVDQAHRARLAFDLVLPNQSLPLKRGAEHYKSCLRVLARFEVAI